jgi:hypothetical protein
MQIALNAVKSDALVRRTQVNWELGPFASSQNALFWRIWGLQHVQPFCSGDYNFTSWLYSIDMDPEGCWNLRHETHDRSNILVVSRRLRCMLVASFGSKPSLGNVFSLPTVTSIANPKTQNPRLQLTLDPSTPPQKPERNRKTKKSIDTMTLDATTTSPGPQASTATPLVSTVEIVLRFKVFGTKYLICVAPIE